MKNRTEEAYAIILEALKRNGAILDYRYECLTLKLADDTRYIPDFMVIMPDGVIEFHEVKGTSKGKPYYRDLSGHVKIKIAAEHFPFTFKVVYKVQGAFHMLDV